MASWFFNTIPTTSPASATAGGAAARADAAPAARLTFEGVSRQYGERAALDGLTLDIAPGEILCLLGPSGCGKTTLLRIAAGIERPTGGRVLISDREVAGPAAFVPPEKRGVGLMFQDFALFPHLSIAENVAFGLKSLPRDGARRAALEMLARVGLESYANHYPHILSGGQQQRVALARAMAPRPAVMLMDEPFSGLDVQLRDAMQEETLGLLRETRATSMIVTHHPEEAMRLGDRIAVMRAGKLVQMGSAEELYRRPVDLFVARLFSEINEVPVRVRGGRVATPFGDLAAPGFQEGAEAVLCLRQRGMGLALSGETAGGGLRGTVRAAKFLGEAVRYEVAVEGLDAPLLVRQAPADGIGAGRQVSLALDPDQVLIFPPNGAESA